MPQSARPPCRGHTNDTVRVPVGRGTSAASECASGGAVPYRDLEPAIARDRSRAARRRPRARGVRERAEQRLLELVIADRRPGPACSSSSTPSPRCAGDEEVVDHIERLPRPRVGPRTRPPRRPARAAGYPGAIGPAAVPPGRHHPHGEPLHRRDRRRQRAVRSSSSLWDAGLGVIVDLLGEKTVTAGRRRPLRRPGGRAGGGADLGAAGRSVGPSPSSRRRSPPASTPLTADDGLAEAAAVWPRPGARPPRRSSWCGSTWSSTRSRTSPRALPVDGPVRRSCGRPRGIVIQAYLRDSLGDLDSAHGVEHDRLGRPDRRPPGEGRVLGRRDGHWPGPTAGRSRCTSTRATPTPTSSAAPACSSNTGPAHADRAARVRLAQRALRRPRHRRGRRPRAAPAASCSFQMLYGMEGGLAGAVRSLGPQVDVYAPVGDLVPGMSYLVRRLLENSSNESFVRQTGRHLDAAPPADRAGGLCPERGDGGMTDAAPPMRPSRSVAGTNPPMRAAFARAVDKQATDARDLDIPAVVGAQRISSEARLTSVDPGRIDHVVATAASADAALADEAVAVTQRAAAGWAAQPADERAGVLVARRIVDARPPGRVGGAHGVRGRQAVARGRRRRL